MKKLGLVVICLAVLMVFGCSKTQEAEASGDPCKSFLGYVLNSCATHTVDTQREEPDTSAGVGADVVIFKDGSKIHEKLKRLEEVVVEYKADFTGYEDTHHSVYAVARLDASDVLPGIWGKIKSIFKRNSLGE